MMTYLPRGIFSTLINFHFYYRNWEKKHVKNGAKISNVTYVYAHKYVNHLYTLATQRIFYSIKYLKTSENLCFKRF